MGTFRQILILATLCVFVAATNAAAELRGTGYLDAVFTTVSMSRDVVQGLLPEGLELADHTSRRVPVIFIFGHHRDVRPDIGHGLSATGLIGLKYLEFIFGVPSVHLKGTPGDQRLTFMPRLFLDRVVPVWMGYPYGFAKTVAEIHASKNHYAVLDAKTHEELIVADWAADGAFENPWDIANFSLIQDILTQPMIGKTPAGFACSNFNWSLRGSSIQPLRAEVSLKNAFLSGLVPADYQLPSIDEVPLGAFRVVTQWTLSLPEKCGQVE